MSKSLINYSIAIRKNLETREWVVDFNIKKIHPQMVSRTYVFVDGEDLKGKIRVDTDVMEYRTIVNTTWVNKDDIKPRTISSHTAQGFSSKKEAIESARQLDITVKAWAKKVGREMSECAT